MKMSVFRQGRPSEQLDHLACMELAVDPEATKMVLHARLQNQPVLVGLEGGEAIIKLWEEGDERLSFEKLYDTCISLRDYRKMQDLKLPSPQDFPPSLYEAQIFIADFDIVPVVRVRFAAKSDIDGQTVLTAWVNNPEFREQMMRRFIMQILESDGVLLKSRGVLKIGEVAPEGLTYEFQDDD